LLNIWRIVSSNSDFTDPSNWHSVFSLNHLNENGLDQIIYSIYIKCLLHSRGSRTAYCTALDVFVSISAYCWDMLIRRTGTFFSLCCSSC
jgi:hypothetical protein